MDDQTEVPQTEQPLSRAMLALEGNDTIDEVTDRVQPVLDALAQRPAVRDALQGRWAGHALHPMVVLLPLGTWISASLLDLSDADRDGTAARLLVAAGLAATVPAVASGLAEMENASVPQRRVATVHAIVNGGGAALQGCSLLARAAGGRRVGTLLSLAGVGLAGASGYLGGHLSVSRDVGTKDPVFDEA